MEGKKTVLIVEDDNFLRGLSAGKLSDEGYEVLTASNGEEAIKIAGESKPMMILLDLLLPNVDGFTALKSNFTLDELVEKIKSVIG